MAILYTYEELVFETAARFASYSQIMVSPTDSTSPVRLAMTTSGTVDFSAKLGSRSAYVEGQAGNDNLTLGRGNDTVWGYSGDDLIYGGDGNDTLVGDWLTDGILGNDTLYGGGGNDLLVGDHGFDIVFGGAGDDIILMLDPSFEPSYAIFGGDGFDVFGLAAPEGAAGFTYTLSYFVLEATSSIEGLYVQSDDIVLRGTPYGDVIDLTGLLVTTGDRQIFTIDLLGGADRYTGGAGGDRLTLSSGSDTVNLGDGNDTLYVADATTAGSSLDGGAGQDDLYLGAPGQSWTDVRRVTYSATWASFENIYCLGLVSIDGTANNDRLDFTRVGVLPESAPVVEHNTWLGDDTLEAGAAANRIFLGGGNDLGYGGAGDDSIYGDVGNDVLEGDAGADRLLGGNGDDVTYGGEGDDVHIGGPGNDTMYGGHGNDTFYIDSAGDRIAEIYNPVGYVDSERDEVLVSIAEYELPQYVERLEFIGAGPSLAGATSTPTRWSAAVATIKCSAAAGRTCWKDGVAMTRWWRPLAAGRPAGCMAAWATTA